MYCIKCGNEIPEGLTECPDCTPVHEEIESTIDNKVESVNTEVVSNEESNTIQVSNSNSYDTSTRGMAATGFFIPPVGIIFYFLSKKDTPVRAKTALQGALFGLTTYALAAIIFIFLILPIEKRYVMKYLCIHNTPGSTYNYATYTCYHPDGSEENLMIK